MSFPAYPEYKDSGAQWLGQIPSGWASIPFGALFRRTKRTGFAGEELLSVYRDYGVIRKSDRDDNFNNASDDLSTYQLVEPGDLAMNKMKAWQGSLGISSHRGIVSPAYFVFSPRREFHPPFLHYLLRSPPYAAGYMTISKGIRINQWDVDPDHLSSLPVMFPSLDEQAAIAALLDRETAKIDALVAEQERLIALLKEKRQAVISHAVTKGLNPHAPMKDSGIEWLGEIPAHWEICRLKHVVQKTDGLQMGPFGGMLTSLAVEQTGFKLYGQENTISGDFERGARWITSSQYEEMARYALLPGDMVLTRKGSLGACRLVPPDIQPGIADSDTVRIRLDHGFIEPDFAISLMKDAAYVATQVDLTKRGAILAGLNTSVIANLVFALPPLGEQFQISSYLEALREQFGELISESQAAITLLQERRAALISAAVTGKIDVRGEVISSNVVALESARPNRASPALSAIVGTYAIRELGPMGRMAVMKAGYLAEAYAGLSDLNGRYERYAAGPYDRVLLTAMERGANEFSGIITHEPRSAGEAVTYQVPKTATAPFDALRIAVGEEAADRFRSMLSLLKGIGRDGVEAVATIYAVWNDLLADKKDAGDDLICCGVLTDWHPEKANKFKRSDLDHWLGWMRRHGFTPDGTAPRTDNQGKLF